MEDGKKQHPTPSCVCGTIPTHHIEMLKQKISFYRLMFVQSLTFAIGLLALYFHYILGSESTTQNQRSFLKRIFVEPEIVVLIAIMFLMFMMMQALSAIYICIGELGDPRTKKIGYSMSLGSILLPILILGAIWTGLLPAGTGGAERLDVILWSLLLCVVYIVTFHLIDAKAYGLWEWVRRRRTD